MSVVVVAAKTVVERVTDVLVDTLNIEPEEVKLTSTLGELGATAIDLLDTVFRLDREFGIHTPPGKLAPEHAFQGDVGTFLDQTVQSIVDYVNARTL